jgi:hypothetical protein
MGPLPATFGFVVLSLLGGAGISPPHYARLHRRAAALAAGAV